MIISVDEESRRQFEVNGEELLKIDTEGEPYSCLSTYCKEHMIKESDNIYDTKMICNPKCTFCCIIGYDLHATPITQCRLTYKDFQREGGTIPAKTAIEQVKEYQELYKNLKFVKDL